MTNKGGVATFTLSLIPHPQSLPRSVTRVTVEVTATDRDDVLLDFVIHGGELVVLPSSIGAERVDGLWATTCFELFLKPEGGSDYFEFNFSPSCQWAAYVFDDYRCGRRNLHLAVDPHLESDPERSRELSVDVDLSNLPDTPLGMALCAVIEETDGTKSYWALAHPPGPPDFHDPDCFTATLA